MTLLPSPAATVESSSTQTATGTGTASETPTFVHGLIFILDVTAAATDGLDTLDVSIQTDLDGTNYVDIVAFTQVDGTATTVRHVDFVTPGLGQAAFDYSASLGAGTQRNVIGQNIRTAWTIVSGNSASFTFSTQLVRL